MASRWLALSLTNGFKSKRKWKIILSTVFFLFVLFFVFFQKGMILDVCCYCCKVIVLIVAPVKKLQRHSAVSNLYVCLCLYLFFLSSQKDDYYNLSISVAEYLICWMYVVPHCANVYYVILYIYLSIFPFMFFLLLCFLLI